MSRSFLLGILLSVLPLLACQSSAPAGQGGGPGPAPAATLAVLDSSGVQGPFAIGGLERLSLALSASNLETGSHDLRLDVTNPTGVLYAQFPSQVTVSSDGNAASSAGLQVRGTTIESFHEVGTWQVAAFVDGSPLASASLEISE